MGFCFPERPVLFYPSLARTIGADEALLLALYHEQVQLRGAPDVEGYPSCILHRQDWLMLADFWDEERLAITTNSLVDQGYVQAAFGQSGAVRISVVDQAAPDMTPAMPTPRVEPPLQEPQLQASQLQEPPTQAPQTQSSQTQAHAARPASTPHPATWPAGDPYAPATPPARVQTLPVVDQPPARSVYQAPPQVRGPAPTFGGSIGWSKSRPQPGAGNVFASQLDEIEQKNQKLHSMFLGWRPSQILFEMLPRHSIPAEFAEQLLDEFVLYWLDKDRKESNWDQKFLAWVKREWVKKQTREAREQRFTQDSNAGVNHENPRTDTREKRKRVTAAIMDIKDTDW